MHADGLTLVAWVGCGVLALVTWRVWKATLRQHRYVQRVWERRARAQEDACWDLYRREEYLQALKHANRNGDLGAALVLFDESIRYATRKYPRLAEALKQ